MKIIATTQNGFILEATETELANIAGYASKFSGIPVAFTIGTNIAVSNIFQKLNVLALAKTELAATEDKLKALAQEIKTLRTDGPIKNA